jgi:ABC-type uncharacterized transport system permease subunit
LGAGLVLNFVIGPHVKVDDNDYRIRMLLTTFLVAALYLGATWQALRLPAAEVAPQKLWIVPAALILHGALLGLQTVQNGALQIGVGEAASLFTGQTALILWLVCLTSPLQSLGIGVYPLAAACVIWPALSPNAGSPVTDWTVALHILFSLLSAGLLTLAAIQALAITVLENILHRPGNLAMARRLPPLQTMERFLFQLIFIGFFLLSLTLLSGMLLNHEEPSQPPTMIVMSFLAWLMFSVLIFGRLRYGWRARTATRWMLTGYVTLVVAYFGSKIVLGAYLP